MCSHQTARGTSSSLSLSGIKAPETVEMQALMYGALVSRFTRGDLERIHARYRTRMSGPIIASDAAAELDAWAEITEETLGLPKIVLMATDFPQTVTATVVFLHQQLGLDTKLWCFTPIELRTTCSSPSRSITRRPASRSSFSLLKLTMGKRRRPANRGNSGKSIRSPA
jgi:hypothetical protein